MSIVVNALGDVVTAAGQVLFLLVGLRLVLLIEYRRSWAVCPPDTGEQE